MMSDNEDPVWIPELLLRQSDKAILEKPNEWLTDRLVYAGMLMLKKQFSDMNGFGDPLMVAALRCDFQSKPFVQVVYNGKNHWITATNIDCSAGRVRVYDSLHLSPNVIVKQQLAAMCHTTQSALEVQCMNVARQVGSGDCGLLALAYATSICLRQDPVNIMYAQHKLRRHYLQCVSAGIITAFPVSSNRTVRKTIAFKMSYKVYCTCRQIYVTG